MRFKGKKPIFSYKDCWSLDYTFSPVLKAGLVKFKEELKKHPFGGYPSDFHDEENDPMGEQAFQNWIEVLDKMIYAFDLKNEPNILDYDFEFVFDGSFPSLEPSSREEYDRFTQDEAEYYEKCKEGRELFAKYFNNLWI